MNDELRLGLLRFAYVAPVHSGHCCFLPADSTCHATEVAAWEARRAGHEPQGASNGGA
jgi:hypothetical protein